MLVLCACRCALFTFCCLILVIFVLSVVKLFAVSGSRGSARVNLLLSHDKQTAWEQEERLPGSAHSCSVLKTALILGITTRSWTAVVQRLCFLF